jgi:hypothetical protein
MDTERVRRLAAQTEHEHPESWRPEPGDVLVGTFVRRDSGVSSYDGKTYTIVVIRDENGVEHGVWAFHTALRQQLSAARPKPGEAIALRYRGKRQGANATYHDWRVAVDREQSEDDWSDLEGEAADVEPDWQPQVTAAADDETPF